MARKIRWTKTLDLGTGEIKKVKIYDGRHYGRLKGITKEQFDISLYDENLKDYVNGLLIKNTSMAKDLKQIKKAINNERLDSDNTIAYISNIVND
jgi:hypothetical protein